MKTPLTTEQLEALRRLDASTLANAIESFQHRLRNEGFTDGSVRCLFPHLPHVAGYAATVKIRGSAPPVAGNAYLERTDWWDYVVAIPTPRVVVVQDMATRPGLGFAAWRGARQHPARAAVASARLPTAPCGTCRRPKKLVSNFSPAVLRFPTPMFTSSNSARRWRSAD